MADSKTSESNQSTLYFDHGATSWPKPSEVVEAVSHALVDLGGNPGRGAYRLAMTTGRALHGARKDLCALLGVPDARDLLFQPGCTQAMNLVLLGLIGPGDRVVACSMEHNAVARPLNILAAQGAEVVVVEADEAGVLDPDEVEQAVAAAPTRAVVCQHAGNVTGAIQPVADLADIAHAHGALMLVDGAQAGGHLAVDLSTLGADAWACSGHKGLLGPSGVGLLYLASGCEPRELISGGTGGSASEEPLQPTARPDRYEAGTPNIPGVMGLGAAARLLLRQGAAMREHDATLVRRLHEGLLEIEGFRVLGPAVDEPRVPLLSVVHDDIAADRLAFALDRSYNVATRAGLHCAPWAHKTLGTLETGALRFGIGYGNTAEQVDVVLEALQQLVVELT